jgi:hypothetical protein
MLSGPTGAGFALRSNWQMSESGGEMKFSTDSTIMLESSWGDIPLPNLGDRIHVVCDTTQFDGVGVFDSVRWGGVDVTFSSPTGSYATQLENFTGGQVGLPGVSWGIALGADVGDDAAPLNAAVPYLYATAQSGYSFEYENVSLGTEDSYSATFAFAPGDGTIYASITGLPVIGDFALGISTNGYLPYVPARIPTGAVDPNILGHFYLRGAVSLDDIGAPLDVGGDLVLDLDANDNGVLLGGALSAERITESADVFQGSLSSVTSLLARATTILRDVQIGINTNLDLSFHGLGLSLSRSSLWLTPNEIAFRAATSNPFQGIPYLENVPTPNGIDVQGFHRRGGVWRASFNAEAGIPGVFGGLSAEAGSHLNGIRVSAFVTGSLPMVGGFNIRLTGTVLTNGNFVLTGTTTVDVGPIDGTLLLSLSRINGRMRISWRIL